MNRSAKLMRYLSNLTGCVLIVVVCVAAGQRATAPNATARQQALASANTHFALDVYAKLSRNPGNLFFSPYGISSLLSMTWAGARGKTAEEIAGALHFSMAPAEVHAAFGDLTRSGSAT